MEVEEKGEVLAVDGVNRRVYPRALVDEAAQILLMDRGSTMQCNVVDFSLGGCRLRTWEPFIAGPRVCVEVTFKVRGIDLRFRGMTQWTDGRHLVGIRFVDLSSRRREDLAEVLSEVEAVNAARAEKEAAAMRAVEERSAEERFEEESEMKEEEQIGTPAPVEPLSSRAEEFIWEKTLYPGWPADATAKSERRERRGQPRHEVNDSAAIFLINVGVELPGHIVDLSLSGCRIRTEGRFLVGIYTRVETEFQIDGLPFRLGGVIQAIHDPHQVGIHFIDLSDRKRAQIEHLIEELEEERRSASARSRKAQPRKLMKAKEEPL